MQEGFTLGDSISLTLAFLSSLLLHRFEREPRTNAPRQPGGIVRRSLNADTIDGARQMYHDPSTPRLRIASHLQPQSSGDKVLTWTSSGVLFVKCGGSISRTSHLETNRVVLDM